MATELTTDTDLVCASTGERYTITALTEDKIELTQGPVSFKWDRESTEQDIQDGEFEVLA